MLICLVVGLVIGLVLGMCFTLYLIDRYYEFENRPVELCNDDRYVVIEKAKKQLLEQSKIKAGPNELAVLDAFLFKCWQFGWLDAYRKAKDEPNKEN